MARKSEFISESRQAIRDLMEVFSRINTLNREYQANGSSSWLGAGEFIDEHSDITEANFESAFGNAATLDGYVATQNYDDTFYKIF